jgi:hypothetical protein
VLNEGPSAVLFEGDPQFFLRVHHDGAVPDNRLPDGLPDTSEIYNTLVV